MDCSYQAININSTLTTVIMKDILRDLYSESLILLPADHFVPDYNHVLPFVVDRDCHELRSIQIELELFSSDFLSRSSSCTSDSLRTEKTNLTQS